MSVPSAQTTQLNRHDCSLPNRSFKSKDIKAPSAAPRMLNDVIFAVRFASPVWSFVQFEGRRLKSVLKESKRTDALYPPSS